MIGFQNDFGLDILIGRIKHLGIGKNGIEETGVGFGGFEISDEKRHFDQGTGGKKFVGADAKPGSIIKVTVIYRGKSNLLIFSLLFDVGLKL